MKTFEDLLVAKYGPLGSKSREKFEEDSSAFRLGLIIKDLRKKNKLTQTQLAERIGTQKAYISRLESGNVDIRVSTLFRIFEDGLDKRLDFLISEK